MASAAGADPQRDLVKQALEYLGFKAEAIPEHPDKKQADLRAEKDGVVAYVEVKSRLEDEKATAVLDATVPGGPVETYIGSASKRNKFSSMVQDAAEQLAATALQETSGSCGSRPCRSPSSWPLANR